MKKTNEMGVVLSHIGDGGADIVGIANDLGVNFIEQPLPSGQSGAIEVDDGTYTIFINASDSPGRKRFTAAHELGHYILHKDLLHSEGRLHRHEDILFGESSARNPVAPFRPEHEVQANKFAAEVLMPAGLVTEAYDQTRDNVVEMARRFGVSKQAMKVRLASLSLRRMD